MALFLFGLVYRVRLALMLGDTFASDVPMPLRALLRQGAADAMFALSCAGLTFLLAQLFSALSTNRKARWLGLFVLTLVLLDLGIMCQAHYGTFFATGNGLTAQILEESLTWLALKELTILLTPGEIIFMLLPPIFFFALLKLPQKFLRPTQRIVAGAATVLVLFGCIVPAAPLPEALLHHPIGFVALDLARSRRQLPLLPSAMAGNDQGLPSETEMVPESEGPLDKDAPLEKSIGAAAKELPVLALSSPLYVYSESERPSKKILPKLDGKPEAKAGDTPPYNILFVLMESTGLDYALRPIPGPGDRLAMPFLRSLGEKGYLLRNHFSSGNSSPRGIFSLLSGLYVMPEVSIFDVRKDIFLPSLGTYLGERYHRFLVTPGSLDWYFPHAFLLHSGFSELWGYHALPVRKNAPGGRAHARDEADTVSFFLRRLDEHVATGAPFSAVYYSFLAHWPYPDYGAETHIVNNPTRPLHAYYNDLHYLDTQIARIFAHLEERKLLDNTIVVLVGDHGEAFGQHANNYTHSRMSYNENLRTPAIIYQPRLFPPRVFTAPTSHVDILPTILDALGVSYDAAMLQGESLFQEQFRRRYIFVYGNEDTLTSISADLIKMQISLRDGSCWIFDLKTDSDEHRRQSCAPHTAQQQALLQYRRHQQTALRRYNQMVAHAAR